MPSLRDYYQPPRRNVTELLAEYAPPTTQQPDSGSAVGNAMSRGVANTIANAQNLLARGQETFGFYDAAAENYAGAQRRVEEAAAANQRHSAQDFTQAWKDGNAGTWLAESFGENLPNLALAAGTAALTRRAAAPTLRRSLAGNEGALKFLGPKAAARIAGQADNIAAGAGAFIPSAALNTGEYIGGQDNSQPGQNLAERNAYAGGVGVLSGAADAIVPTGFVGKFTGKAAMPTLRGGLREVGKEMLQEGSTEVGQQALANLGHYAEGDMAAVQNRPDDYINQFVGGAAGAGPLSAGTTLAAPVVNNTAAGLRQARALGRTAVDATGTAVQGAKDGFAGRTLLEDAPTTEAAGNKAGSVARGVYDVLRAAGSGAKEGVGRTDIGDRVNRFTASLQISDPAMLDKIHAAVADASEAAVNGTTTFTEYLDQSLRGALRGAGDNRLADNAVALSKQMFADLDSPEAVGQKVEELVRGGANLANDVTANTVAAGMGAARGVANSRPSLELQRWVAQNMPQVDLSNPTHTRFATQQFVRSTINDLYARAQGVDENGLTDADKAGLAEAVDAANFESVDTNSEDFHNKVLDTLQRVRAKAEAEGDVEGMARADKGIEFAQQQFAQRQQKQPPAPAPMDAEDEVSPLVGNPDEEGYFSRSLQLRRVQKQRGNEVAQVLGFSPDEVQDPAAMKARMKQIAKGGTEYAAALQRALSSIDDKYNAEQARVNEHYDYLARKRFDEARGASYNEDGAEVGDQPGNADDLEYAPEVGGVSGGMQEYNPDKTYIGGSRGDFHAVRKGASNARTPEYIGAARRQDEAAATRGQADLGWESAATRIENMTDTERAGARKEILDNYWRDYRKERLFKFLRDRFGEDAGTREQYEKLGPAAALAALDEATQSDAKRFLRNSEDKYRHYAFIDSFLNDRKNVVPPRLRDALTMSFEDYKAKYNAPQPGWRTVIAELAGVSGASDEAFAKHFGDRYTGSLSAQEDRILQGVGFPTVADKDDSGTTVPNAWWARLRADGKESAEFPNITLRLANRAASDEVGGVARDGKYLLVINPAQLANLGKELMAGRYDVADDATRMRFFAEGFTSVLNDPRVAGIASGKDAVIKAFAGHVGAQGPEQASRIQSLDIDGARLAAGFKRDGSGVESFDSLREAATGEAAGRAAGEEVKRLRPEFDKLAEQGGAAHPSARHRARYAELKDRLYKLGAFKTGGSTWASAAYDMTRADTVGELEALSRVFQAGMNVRRSSGDAEARKKAFAEFNELMADPSVVKVLGGFDPQGKLARPQAWVGDSRQVLEQYGADIDERLDDAYRYNLGMDESIAEAKARSGEQHYDRDMASDGGFGVVDTLELSDPTRDPSEYGTNNQADRPFNYNNPRARATTPNTRFYEPAFAGEAIDQSTRALSGAAGKTPEERKKLAPQPAADKPRTSVALNDRAIDAVRAAANGLATDKALAVVGDNTALANAIIEEGRSMIAAGMKAGQPVKVRALVDALVEKFGEPKAPERETGAAAARNDEKDYGYDQHPSKLPQEVRDMVEERKNLGKLAKRTPAQNARMKELEKRLGKL